MEPEQRPEGSGPIFKMTEESEVDTVWFISGAPGMDWMGMVYRDSEVAPWRGTYRFRYYVTHRDGTFDSNPFNRDRKSVYDLGPMERETGPEELRKIMQMIAEKILQLGKEGFAEEGDGITLSVHPVGGGMKELIELLRSQPWAHVKMAEREQ